MDDRPAMAGLGRWKKKQFVAVSSSEKHERRRAGMEDREHNTQKCLSVCVYLRTSAVTLNAFLP